MLKELRILQLLFRLIDSKNGYRCIMNIAYNINKKLDTIQCSADSDTRYWKELFYPCEVEGGNGYRAVVEEDRLDHWRDSIKEFNKLEIDIHGPTSHTQDIATSKMKVVDAKIAPDSQGRPGLFGLCEFNDSATAAEWKDTQVSVYSPKRCTINGKEFFRPITHVALTDDPAVPGLDEFEAISASLVPKSKEKSSMSIKELAKGLNIEVESNASDEDVSTAISASYKLVTDNNAELHSKVEELTKTVEEKSAIAASLEQKHQKPDIKKGLLKPISDSRDAILCSLVKDGKILPVQKEALATLFCDQDAIACSADKDYFIHDGFDKIVKILEEGQAIEMGHALPGQGGKPDLSYADRFAERNPVK